MLVQDYRLVQHYIQLLFHFVLFQFLVQLQIVSITMLIRYTLYLKIDWFKCPKLEQL